MTYVFDGGAARKFVLARFAAPLFRIVSSDVSHLAVERVETALDAPRTCELRFEFGQTRWAIRAYRMFRPCDRKAYRRDRDVLRYLDGWFGAPRYLLGLDAIGLLITRKPLGQSVTTALATADPLAIAEQLGDWLARFDAVAPRQQVADSWGDHLMAFPGGFDQRTLAEAWCSLKAIPVRSVSLGGTAARIDNLVLTRCGSVAAQRFDACDAKPRGWDVIEALMALISRTDADPRQLSEAILRGFSTAGAPSRLVEELTELSEIVLRARARAVAEGRV
ncbi:hypothetical protein [Litorisediminicola beolgyonensis]|uniref:Uncharacterized protein n=1 Tax=Litorisediminicola beolgyonensis TaxID=1173614 RepID=A0ABW3ZDD9_9RHOB